MQRAIWIVTFLIIVAMSYKWFYIDEKNSEKMGELVQSDQELSGDVNSTLEVHDRLEKKWIGTSKHVKTLQEETHSHYKAYATHMDSIDNALEIIKLDIENLRVSLVSKIDRVKEDIKNLDENFESFKRETKRKLRQVDNDISLNREDIKKLNAEVFPPPEEDKKKKQ